MTQIHDSNAYRYADMAMELHCYQRGAAKAKNLHNCTMTSQHIGKDLYLFCQFLNDIENENYRKQK